MQICLGSRGAASGCLEGALEFVCKALLVETLRSTVWTRQVDLARGTWHELDYDKTRLARAYPIRNKEQLVLKIDGHHVMLFAFIRKVSGLFVGFEKQTLPLSTRFKVCNATSARRCTVKVQMPI